METRPPPRPPGYGRCLLIAIVGVVIGLAAIGTVAQQRIGASQPPPAPPDPRLGQARVVSGAQDCVLTLHVGADDKLLLPGHRVVIKASKPQILEVEVAEAPAGLATAASAARPGDRGWVADDRCLMPPR